MAPNERIQVALLRVVESAEVRQLAKGLSFEL